MKFEIWNAEQYRSANLDALEARYAAIADELVNAESAFSYDELEAEARSCKEAIDRQERAAEIRKHERSAVASGAGFVRESSKDVEVRSDIDVYDTNEYRNAFMEYIQRGAEMPTEFRTNDGGTIIATPTVTTGVPPQVPTTMQRQIISKMEENGQIWSRVRKMSVKGGIWFRVLDLKPTATWLMENTGTELSVSRYQGVTNDATISFSFYELECRMAQSLLAAATTFEDFQALFVPAVADAMVVALEAAIVRGDGNGKFSGIVNEGRITNKAGFTTTTIKDWKAWHTEVDAKILPEYDNGGFIMAKSTWNKYIDTLADKNDSPIAEYHYDPVSGKRVCTLMGKPVMLVSTRILPDFDTASDNEVFCIYGNLNDYVVNTQPGMPLSTVRWIDHETNQEKMKSLMAADGKVLDPYGFMLIQKGAVA